MARKYFPFYFTFYETAQTMPPKLRAVFYEALIEYGTTGTEPTLPKSIAGYWPLVKPMLDAAKSHYEAGTNGGRPSKSDSFGFPDSITNGSYKEKEKEKDNEKDASDLLAVKPGGKLIATLACDSDDDAKPVEDCPLDATPCTGNCPDTTYPRHL